MSQWSPRTPVVSVFYFDQKLVRFCPSDTLTSISVLLIILRKPPRSRSSTARSSMEGLKSVIRIRNI